MQVIAVEHVKLPSVAVNDIPIGQVFAGTLKFFKKTLSFGPMIDSRGVKFSKPIHDDGDKSRLMLRIANGVLDLNDPELVISLPNDTLDTFFMVEDYQPYQAKLLVTPRV